MEDAKAKARDAPVDGDALSEKPAAPAAKKKKTKIGPMDSYVQSKKQINDATCNFVLANALITEPEGYKNKFDEAAKLNEQLDNAYDNNDFETVEKVQPKYDAAINRARFEEKLFQSALSAHDYASQKLDDAKKMRQVEKCKKYYKIIKASEEYIEKVPEDDKIVSTDDTEDEVVVEETPINNNEDGDDDDDDDDEDDDDEQQLDDAEDETAQPRLSSSFQAGKKSRAGRARKEKKSSAPTTKTSAVVTAPKPKNKGPKVSGVKLKQMLKKTYKVDVTVDGEKKKVDVDMKIEPYYSLSRGSIICDCCNKQIREDNLAKHTASAKHKEQKERKMKMDADDEANGRFIQARLQENNLVGRTVDNNVHAGDMLLLRAFAAGNVPAKAIDRMAVRTLVLYLYHMYMFNNCCSLVI